MNPSTHINFFLFFNIIWCNAELSTKFKICVRSDPNLNDCLKAAIEHALAVLKNGFPELNIPPLEPLKITKWTSKPLPPITFSQEYTNLELHNYVSSEIKEINAIINDTNFYLKLKVFSPTVKILTNYDYQNAILDEIDMSSKGKLTGEFTEFTSYVTLIGQVRKNGDTEYLYITAVTVDDMNVKNVHYTYESEDVEKAKLLSNYMNSNWEAVITKGKKKYEELYAIAYKKEANSIFARIPFNVLFPK